MTQNTHRCRTLQIRTDADKLVCPHCYARTTKKITDRYFCKRCCKHFTELHDITTTHHIVEVDTCKKCGSIRIARGNRKRYCMKCGADAGSVNHVKVVHITNLHHNKKE